MKKWIMLFLAMVLFPFMLGVNGCQTTGTNYYYDNNGAYVEITDPAAQCVLYRVVGDTSKFKVGLFALNYAAIKAGLYTGEQAVAELDKIEAETVRPGATVGSFLNTLFITAANAAKAGAPEIVVITQSLAAYRSDMTPLDDCTRYKLLNHIGGQRMVALAFAN